MNLETIIDMQSWYKAWPPNGYDHTRVKQKLLRKRRRACKSSWSRRGHLKSLTMTIPWNLENLVKNYHGIIVRQRHTDQKHMGLPKEQCAESRKGHLRYCCNQVWTKNGGRILWNSTAICEMSKTSCLMGRHLTRSDSEFHLMAR